MPGKQFKEAEKSFAHARGSVEKDAFYIFNADNNGGFVIVSGDDRTIDILGYSDKGRLNIEKAPCNVKWLLECYQQVLDSLAQEPNVKSKAKTRGSSSSRAEIAPLITTHWGQGAPYNNLCPEFDGEKCVTGCVATAMSQIMNYHKWPQGNTNVIDAYTTSSLGIDMPKLEPTTFNWNDMTNDEVARLMLYCGQSVNMDYRPDASGAARPENAFVDVFGYSKSTQGFGGKKFTSVHWENHIYNELTSNRPVYYTGHSSKLGGHAFVVDGYKDGLFHINWGWNGDEDGYFLLTGLTEDIMPFPYDYETEACLGLEPPALNASSSKVITEHCSFYPRSLYRANSSEGFIPRASFSSNLFSDFDGATYYVGYGLYNDNGLVKVLGQEKKSFPLNESYHLYLNIGNDIPQGTYRIIPIYRHNESENWMVNAGVEQHHIIAHVNEKSLVFEDPIDDNNGDYQEFDVVELDGITYKLYSEFGNKWAGILPYQITGKYFGDVVIPNKIEHNDIKYVVESDELAFSTFVDCEDLVSLTVGAESGINRIANCPKLKKVVLTHGNSVVIENCNLLEDIEFPITMDYPNIRNCNNLKTISIKCLAVSWNSIATTTVDWDDTSLPSLTDVYLYTPIPPLVGKYDVLENEHWISVECDIPANSQATLHVPKGSLETYKSSRWKLWNIVDDLPAAPFVTWGYCHSDAVTNSGMSSGMGDNDAEYGMFVPAEEMTAYIGSQITHIQVYSPNRSINDYGYEDYEYVFITKPGTDYLVKQPFETIRGAWNTIKLDKPYTITGDPLYVGVGRHNKIGIRFADDTYVLNASWQRPMGNDNGDTENMFVPGEWVLPCPKDQAHPLPLRFAIEGESVPEGVVIRDMKLVESEYPTASARTRGTDSGVKIQGTIRNRSLETITSYKVEWAIDGSEKGSQTFETEIKPNGCEFITIDLPAKVGVGHHEMTFDVTSINNGINNLSGTYLPVFEIGTKPDYFIVNTVENIPMKFKALDEETKTCQVGNGAEASASIDQSTSGTVTIPSTADGYKVVAIGENAFKGCAKIETVGMPSDITSIGEAAFSGCTMLTAIVSEIKTPFAINDNTFSSETYTNAILTVPYGKKEAYSKADGWKKFKNVLETVDESAITIKAKNYTIVYGESMPTFEYTSEGGGLSGSPEITCEATVKSPVGTYTITIAKGSVKNPNVTYTNGKLTITKAPLTISAGKYTRKKGRENPDFVLNYKGFKNGETEEVLTKKPIITTTATKTSAIGDYPVTVSGAEAKNYEITYVNGVLTIELLPGDANCDGVVDENDVKAIANHIIGETQGDFDEDAADLNNDGKVNVADIVELNNLLSPKD